MMEGWDVDRALVAAIDSMADAGRPVCCWKRFRSGCLPRCSSGSRRAKCHARASSGWRTRPPRWRCRPRRHCSRTGRLGGFSVKMMGEAPSVAFAKVTDPAGNVLFVSQGEAGAGDARSGRARADSADDRRASRRVFRFGNGSLGGREAHLYRRRPARLCLGGDRSRLGRRAAATRFCASTSSSASSGSWPRRCWCC